MGNYPVSVIRIAFPIINIKEAISVLKSPMKSHMIRFWNKTDEKSFCSSHKCTPLTTQLFSPNYTSIKGDVWIWGFLDGQCVFLTGKNHLCSLDSGNIFLNSALCYVALVVYSEFKMDYLHNLCLLENHVVPFDQFLEGLCCEHRLKTLEGHSGLVPIFSTEYNVTCETISSKQSNLDDSFGLCAEVYKYTGTGSTEATRSEACSQSKELINNLKLMFNHMSFPTGLPIILANISSGLKSLVLSRNYNQTRTLTRSKTPRRTLVLNPYRNLLNYRSKTFDFSAISGDSLSQEKRFPCINNIKNEWSPFFCQTSTTLSPHVSALALSPRGVRHDLILDQTQDRGQSAHHDGASSNDAIGDIIGDLNVLRSCYGSAQYLFNLATYINSRQHKLSLDFHKDFNLKYSSSSSFVQETESCIEENNGAVNVSLSSKCFLHNNKEEKEGAFNELSESSEESGSHEPVGDTILRTMSWPDSSITLDSLCQSPSFMSPQRLGPEEMRQSVPLGVSLHKLRCKENLFPRLQYPESQKEHSPNGFYASAHSAISPFDQYADGFSSTLSDAVECDNESFDVLEHDPVQPSPKRRREKTCIGKIQLSDLLNLKQSDTAHHNEIIERPKRIVEFTNSDFAIRQYSCAFQAASLSVSPERCALKYDILDVSELDGDMLNRYRNLCSEIVPGARLYIGGVAVAKNTSLLQCLEITHIINLAGDCCPRESYPGIHLLTLVLHDNRYAAEEFESILFFVLDYINECLNEPSHRLLIHCREGVSRSSSVVIAYIMWKARLSFQVALNIVRHARPCCNPNTGFTFSLLRFQKLLAHSTKCVDAIFREKQRIVSTVVQSPQETTEVKKYMLYNPLYSERPWSHSKRVKSNFLDRLRAAPPSDHVPVEPFFQRRLLRLTPHNVMAPFVVTLGVSLFDSLHRTWMPSVSQGLDPRFCYILRDDFHFYLWLGADATHKSFMESVFFSEYIQVLMLFEQPVLNAEWTFTILRDGEESDAFWNILNGVPNDSFSCLLNGRRVVHHDCELDDVFSWMMQAKELYNFVDYCYRSDALALPQKYLLTEKAPMHSPPPCPYFSHFNIEPSSESPEKNFFKTSSLPTSSYMIPLSDSNAIVKDFEYLEKFSTPSSYSSPSPLYSLSINSSMISPSSCGAPQNRFSITETEPNEYIKEKSFLEAKLEGRHGYLRSHSLSSCEIHSNSCNVSLGLQRSRSFPLSLFINSKEDAFLFKKQLSCHCYAGRGSCDSLCFSSNSTETQCFENVIKLRPKIFYLYKWPYLDRPIKCFDNGDLDSQDLCIIAQYGSTSLMHMSKRRKKSCRRKLLQKKCFLRSGFSLFGFHYSRGLKSRPRSSRTFPLRNIYDSQHSISFKSVQLPRNLFRKQTRVTGKRNSCYSVACKSISDHLSLDNSPFLTPINERYNTILMFEKQRSQPKYSNNSKKYCRKRDTRSFLQFLALEGKYRTIKQPFCSSKTLISVCPTVLWIWRGSRWVKSLNNGNDENRVLDEFKRLHGIPLANKDIEIYWEVEGNESEKFLTMLYSV